MSIQALLKIVKHCHESLPSMVTGSLLGLATGNGVLEITHSFPFPEARPEKHRRKKDDDDEDDDATGAAAEGTEYQLEMMRLLRDVNVDNNCVGWYQSMYLGIYSTSSLLENQWNYQQDLSPNAVVILFDPLQTTQGKLVLKCYRLSDKCIELRTKNRNVFVDPSTIFEEIPVVFTNPSLVRALLTDIADGKVDMDDGAEALVSSLPAPDNDLAFDRLDLSTNPYLEKHLEFLSSSVDELAAEQQKFAYYARQLHYRSRDENRRNNPKQKRQPREDHRETWATSAEAPKRMESLLLSNQIRTYCHQIDRFTGDGLGKLYLAGGLQPHQSAAVNETTSLAP
jgi:translation initiation factor 3 subunit H